MGKEIVAELQSEAKDYSKEYYALEREAKEIKYDMTRSEERLTVIEEKQSEIVRKHKNIENLLSDKGIGIGSLVPNVR